VAGVGSSTQANGALAMAYSFFAAKLGMILTLCSVAALWGLPAMKAKSSRGAQEGDPLQQAEERFLAASERGSDCFYILRSVRDSAGEIRDFRFEFVNQRGAALVSLKPEDMCGRLLCQLLPFNRSLGYFDQYKGVVESGESLEVDFPFFDADVHASWLHIQAVKLEDGVAITAVDISARKEAEFKLTRLSAFTESIIASSPFATIATDLDGIITAVNPAAERMLWRKRDDLIGKETPLVLLNPQELVQRAAMLSLEMRTTVNPNMDVFKVMPRLGGVEEAQWQLLRSDGSHFDAQLTVSSLTDASDECVGFIFMAYDITERKRTEDYISHLAHHDALTTLPTRALLHDRLQLALSRARRYGTKVGLLMVDLDNFKRVNDVMGHFVGDELLTTVAKRLQGAIRESDTVARVGGDEFVVVLTDMENANEAEPVARKIVDSLNTPVSISGHTFNPVASIGICIFPDHAENSEDLMKNADAAMYRVKSEGRNSFQAFSYTMATETSRQRTLESALHHAISKGELELAFQPQVSMSTGRVIGVEALLRWYSRKLGLIMPDEFIPLAEESGLIVPIGEWVIRTACSQGRQLQMIAAEPLIIAINISPRQFQQDNLVRIVREALEETGMDPKTLELEITENILVNESTKAMGILEEIRAQGIRIAIDDFGTGFSSMSYIMRFRVDHLKIDRSFIRNVTCDPDSRAITTAIIAMAAGLNIPVIAEGVETSGHRDLLMGKGCDEAQGFLYSRPVPFKELEGVISAVHDMQAAQCVLPLSLAAPGRA
jgi:diguanylate cyclase (GGDEF)-like protein/PAS domain S-box-containing protein